MEGIIVVKIDGAWYVVTAMFNDDAAYVSFLDYQGEYDQKAYQEYLKEKEDDKKDEKDED